MRVYIRFGASRRAEALEVAWAASRAGFRVVLVQVDPGVDGVGEDFFVAVTPLGVFRDALEARSALVNASRLGGGRGPS